MVNNVVKKNPIVDNSMRKIINIIYQMKKSLIWFNLRDRDKKGDCTFDKKQTRRFLQSY